MKALLAPANQGTDVTDSIVFVDVGSVFSYSYRDMPHISVAALE